jgi:hypothetical protein
MVHRIHSGCTFYVVRCTLYVVRRKLHCTSHCMSVISSCTETEGSFLIAPLNGGGTSSWMPLPSLEARREEERGILSA